MNGTDAGSDRARMTRRGMLFRAGAACVAGGASIPPAAGDAQAVFPVAAQRDSQSVTAHNIHFQLSVVLEGSCRMRLEHLPTGLILADAAYSYSFGVPPFKEVAVRQEGNAQVLALHATTANGLSVVHELRLPADRVWIEEQIRVVNGSNRPLSLPHARGGFVLPFALEHGQVTGPLKGFKFTAVPYRREPHGGRTEYADYTIAQVLTEPRVSMLRSYPPVGRAGDVFRPAVHATGLQKTVFDAYASEGWALTDGQRGFLTLKYSQQGMEWALLDRVALEGDRLGLRWGGFGIFDGDPEQAAWLAPGAAHSFGITRLIAFDGGVTEAFYVFRRQMEGFGHGCPQGFDPPVHWNELYDNRLYWLGARESDKPENRKKYYSLADMKQEAAKARDMGCEALYLDPGWDTNFASKIWDAERLGPQKDFAAMLQRDYGLRLSLHTPLAGWCNPTSYPRDMDRMLRDGRRAELSLCGASRQYIEETVARLSKLARDGAGFFMFDGTMYHGECWDPNHGHRVPARREEHIQATNRLARMVHARHPRVLIEMHDQLLGGTRLRYVPTYYGHGPAAAGEGAAAANGFDSIWAFEMMWDPMQDLVAGPAIMLYYYNLAYSLPLYIHIDLRKDNEQALMFWWNASTCRHLGIGGTPSDPAVRAAHKEAMAVYRRLKPFFAAGTFYGIDEETHVHRHPSEPRVVINCFNLQDQPVAREVSFDPWKFDLHPVIGYEVKGAPYKLKGGTSVITVEIPACGHKLFELQPRQPV